MLASRTTYFMKFHVPRRLDIFHDEFHEIIVKANRYLSGEAEKAHMGYLNDTVS